MDTHVLLWAAGPQGKLPAELRALIEDPDIEALFSTASIWEIAIKHSQHREDFQVDPGSLRRSLLAEGYVELDVLGEHAVTVATLPWIHKDPFDRLLVAQAIVENADLLTVDRQLTRYPGPIRAF